MPGMAQKSPLWRDFAGILACPELGDSFLNAGGVRYPLQGEAS